LERGIPARLSPHRGREFAFLVGTAFLALGGLGWWRDHRPLTVVCWVVGGLLVLAGIVIPGRLGPVYRAWMGLALVLSRVTAPIFLGIVFFLVIAPMGLVMRLLGRNPMVRKGRGDSFWIDRPQGPQRRSDLTRQF
jgi:hypothetical protein